MAEVTFCMADGHGLVTLHGDLILDKVAKLKDELVKALGQAEQVTIDVDKVAAVDVAGLQLLCACHRFAAGRGKALRLVGMGESFQALARGIGVSRGQACGAGQEDPSCMWARLE